MELNFEGVTAGMMSFVIIGAFHPLVIWPEYHFTQSIQPVFLIAGLLCLIVALSIQDLLSVLLGLLGVACIWSTRELKEQACRAEQGWFPKNSGRKQAGGLLISILLTECVWFYIVISRLVMTNREVYPIMRVKLRQKRGQIMFNRLGSLGTQEGLVKVDLLHPDPIDPDSGCCCRKNNGEHCCGWHSHTQEQMKR